MGLGGFGLFPPSPLENESGLLKERWDQEGSTGINAYAAGSNTTLTLHTVSTGKTAYIKNLVLTNTNAYDGTSTITFTISDNTTTVFKVVQLQGTTETVVPFTPFKFTTSIKIAFSGDCNASVVGWEE